MKKHTLVAMAALAAAGSAAAQSSVTLYGVVDTGYEISQGVRRLHDQNGVQFHHEKLRKVGMVSGVLSGSRWGLKGEEALGNGLSAVFNVEAGFDSTSGAFAGGFNRRSVVGLKGGFGTVVVGRDATPLDNWGFGIDGSTKGDVAYTEHYSGLFYSGEFSGFTVNAMVGGERAKTTRVANGVSTTVADTRTTGIGLGLAYNNGPVGVGGAVQQFRDRAAGAISTEYGVGGSYDFGVAKIFSHYIASKHRVSGGAYSRWEHASIGVSAPFGALTLMAEYGRNRVKAVNDVTRLGDYGALLQEIAPARDNYRINGSGNNFMVGANYALSKRTELYARAGRKGSLKAKAYSATPAGTYLGGFSGYTNYVTVGMRHMF
ncbi:MAG: porin [Brachymonas sp.]|nr:porin [Brachymonas sp.]